mmetsp:Transcript_86247/g.267058  ORF Transcript_86247/g.267058 Transcript_86247/m.267058 type:complete len:206 (-) Transcript_86247:3-620(-)
MVQVPEEEQQQDVREEVWRGPFRAHLHQGYAHRGDLSEPLALALPPRLARNQEDNLQSRYDHRVQYHEQRRHVASGPEEKANDGQRGLSLGFSCEVVGHVPKEVDVRSQEHVEAEQRGPHGGDQHQVAGHKHPDHPTARVELARVSGGRLAPMQQEGFVALLAPLDCRLGRRDARLDCSTNRCCQDGRANQGRKHQVVEGLGMPP